MGAPTTVKPASRSGALRRAMASGLELKIATTAGPSMRPACARTGPVQSRLSGAARFSSIGLLCAMLCATPARAQTLTLAQVEASITAIGETIQREYVDRQLGRDVAASLREGLAEGRFPNLATAQ